MQILIVLLLIVVLTLTGVALFSGLSFALGLYLHSRTGALAAAGDPCAQCNSDTEWYQALPEWQQNVVVVWWWVNRYQCNCKGC